MWVLSESIFGRTCEMVSRGSEGFSGAGTVRGGEVLRPELPQALLLRLRRRYQLLRVLLWYQRRGGGRRLHRRVVQWRRIESICVMVHYPGQAKRCNTFSPRKDDLLCSSDFGCMCNSPGLKSMVNFEQASKIVIRHLACSMASETRSVSFSILCHSASTGSRHSDTIYRWYLYRE